MKRRGWIHLQNGRRLRSSVQSADCPYPSRRVFECLNMVETYSAVVAGEVRGRWDVADKVQFLHQLVAIDDDRRGDVIGGIGVPSPYWVSVYVGEAGSGGGGGRC